MTARGVLNGAAGRSTDGKPERLCPACRRGPGARCVLAGEADARGPPHGRWDGDAVYSGLVSKCYRCESLCFS